ncbi:MAG: 30S ribosomal protein S17 [Candidatus Taylorbacteria bacterium RIFCSPLOWO2_01_FULL_45_15b]|uniref:Small ribosomal subunit protein uS17 n=1 Tax=Candidatus Taylorbacteria bacterium RIFCSPLOWO2_01_FULL_45_15b TaxID=1802319 RepID=A0A1G2N7U2_9BACT|nr:MAG: 30S ribosomal protein S17 [Candidatus Taylorbacteria bacterium RIFCSPLOWO2_01_FULL_45_15b]
MKEANVQLKQPQPKRFQGVVVSTKMKDTVVVSVDRYQKIPKYGKYIKATKRYKAHDAGNTKKEGDRVEIVECRPMSKDKHFRIV